MVDETVQAHCTGDGRIHLENDEASLSELKWLLKGCGGRWDGCAWTKCCTGDIESCVRVEKNDEVEEYKSNEYESGSR